MASKQSYEKLIDALRTIKDECEFHKTSCGSCPLASDLYFCGITGTRTCGDYDYKIQPKYWKIPGIKLLEKPDNFN